MRLTLTKALALALVASIIPGRRAVMPGGATSPAPARRVDLESVPTPDQYKPMDEQS
jgi:hypothetical protein